MSLADRIGERRLERLEHVDAGAGRVVGADQGGMAAEFGKGAANIDRAGVGQGGVSIQIRPPDQS